MFFKLYAALYVAKACGKFPVSEWRDKVYAKKAVGVDNEGVVGNPKHPLARQPPLHHQRQYAFSWTSTSVKFSTVTLRTLLK